MIENSVDEILREYSPSNGAKAPEKEEAKRTATNTTRPAKAAQKPVSKPTKEAKHNEEWNCRMKDGAKWLALFGGLAAVVLFWWQTGQMAISAAVPSLCVCTALAGFGIGKNTVRGER